MLLGLLRNMLLLSTSVRARLSLGKHVKDLILVVHVLLLHHGFKLLGEVHQVVWVDECTAILFTLTE